MNENCFRDLNLSSDEIRRFSDAFSDGEFRELLGQYLSEVNDPVNRKLFENEIIQLERERGNDVQFVKPIPGYVLATSADGSRKVYVNICSCDKVDIIQSAPAVKDRISGKNVSLPHALCPVQKIFDKNNRPVSVYTVVFHPDTLEKAAVSVQLKRCVNETALAFIEKSFDVILDKVNFRVSKTSFKGIAELTTIRKKIVSSKEETSCVYENCRDDLDYVKPVYRLRYRNEVDLQNSTMDRYCKMDALVPKEVIVEIELPLLKSTQSTCLELHSTSVNLVNKNPNYKLYITLPYEVCKENGSAKFDPITRILLLTLKVVKKTSKLSVAEPADKPVVEVDAPECNDDASIFAEPNIKSISNSDQRCCSTTSDESSDSGSLVRKRLNNANDQFLHANVKYKLPPFCCNYFQRKVSFTINVKNVNYGSFDYQIFEKHDGFWVKFSSLGAGHFPMFYAMCVVFRENVNVISSLQYTIENEKVFLYLHFSDNFDFVLLDYLVGIDRNNLNKHYLDEPDAVYREIEDELQKIKTQEVDVGVSKFTSDEVVIDVAVRSDGCINGHCSTNSPIVAASHSDTSTGHANERLPRTSSAADATTPVPMVFDSFEKFEQLRRKMNDRRVVKCEKDDLETEFAQITDFGTFCDNFKKRFSLDEEQHCLSESELLTRPSIQRARNGRGHVTNNFDNRSWIVESKNAKKAKRRKKARDKKLAAADGGSGKHGGGCVGGESEPESENLSKTAYEDTESSLAAADVRSAYKLSDLRSRSILKKNRSYSESSGDELFKCSRSYSIDDINFSSDLYSTSAPKKTVRFNDVILKKLYSSDISILEQRKRTKRRFQRKERKGSDSDNSETEITASSAAIKRENIRVHNENLLSETSENELTSLSESSGETSDDQSDNQDADSKVRDIPCSKKNHKRRGKKSARKNASTAKYQFPADD